jgi:hypothetical protein
VQTIYNLIGNIFNRFTSFNVIVIPEGNLLFFFFFLALCATSCGAFNTASKAFLKLEDDQSINEEDRKEYQKLAFQIFLRYVK